MIDSVNGKIFKKEPTMVYVDTGSIVLSIHICLRDYEKIPNVGESISINTYLNVRENLLELYGFIDEERRGLFKNLIEVSGIGPKTAINLLSNASVSNFKDSIVSEDVKSLSLIPGIGPKTAKRIILDIKEKISDKSSYELLTQNDLEFTYEDIFTALSSLGYKKNQIDNAIKKLDKEGLYKGNIEKVIKRVLSVIRWVIIKKQYFLIYIIT